jgi:pyruvate dehydrogenase E1 component alpha subunit
MDPFAMYDATARALARAKRGEGPTLLEARTYRFRGHSMADPQLYRTKEEIEQYKLKDPIELVKNSLLKLKVTAEEIEKIDAEIHAEVDASIKFSDETPDPQPDDLFHDVMAS